MGRNNYGIYPTTPEGTTYSATNMMNQRTDTQRLDALECLLGRFTGKVVCRWSNTGRGWRLHESSREDAVASVRAAIDAFLNDN